MTNTPHQHPANHLATQHSLYLRQHAHNPVDWYPWGEEALQKAKQEDKPILLSIGYSACHWCHVMAHESFEDPEVAAITNQHFINIKVDREERPDLDSLYMNAVVAMIGQGGWPLTVFLLPEDQTPFYGGTYFPPDEKAARYGMPSFKQVLQAIAEAYTSRREELRTAGQQLVAHMQKHVQLFAQNQNQALVLNTALLDGAITQLQQGFDPQHGGISGTSGPKFPQPMALEYMLRSYLRTSNKDVLYMLEHTLQKMAQGGMYDQLGGGFHRYSVDEQWLVPHFEKMCYDNALLARLYTETFQATRNVWYRHIAEETLDYMQREMLHPAGGFYSTQDADSEGEEGLFFLWTPEEIRQELGEEEASLFCTIYDVTQAGNFEGKNILHLPKPLDQIAQTTGNSVEYLQAIIAKGKDRLFKRREQRIKPARDEKVLTSWNGMALRAFAKAAAVFEQGDYLDIAQRNANFLLSELRDCDGRVWRTWVDTTSLSTQQDVAPFFPSIPGYLEDYAMLADGLIELYQVDGDSTWIQAAIEIADMILTLFWDDELGGFYNTAKDHEKLVVRPHDVDDNAVPSGNSVTVDVLLRITALTGMQNYRARAEKVLQSLAPMMQRVPIALGRLLCAADFALAPVRSVVLAGDFYHPTLRQMVKIVHQKASPSIVLAFVPSALDLPLLHGRDMIDDKPTAYVCEGTTCKMPVTEVEDLRQQLGA